MTKNGKNRQAILTIFCVQRTNVTLIIFLDIIKVIRHHYLKRWE